MFINALNDSLYVTGCGIKRGSKVVSGEQDWPEQSVEQLFGFVVSLQCRS